VRGRRRRRGKGPLAYLRGQAGFRAEVIDPVDQPLPSRYRDLATGRRVRLDQTRVVRRRGPFRPALGRRYDLLVALHAHGSNLAVLDTVAEAGNSCVVLPCCVVDEPAAPGPGQHVGLAVGGARPAAPAERLGG
jgi:hypothetical protein